MKTALNRFACTLALLAVPTAAFAHAGDHSHFSMSALMSHLMEWDHLAMIAGAAVLAIVVFRRFRNRNNQSGAK
ncbi:MAG: hypothetical protein ACRCWF_18350 [Beijerinckiaceae bacterium]